MSTGGDILVVDDTPNNLAVLVGILRESGYQARVANSGRGALSTIAARAPELILLDINMPDMDGYLVCRELKANPDTRDIPVLFISALDDALDKVRAFGVGGVDYIPKPFQAEEVLARVENHLKIGRLQKELQAHATRLQTALAALAEVSVTDPLTGLRNRRFLLDRIESDLGESRRRMAAGVAEHGLLFFMIDVDHFKQVNDRHGHAAGDAVLAEVARRLRATFGDNDYLIRWGGEEFLGVVRFDRDNGAETLARRIRDAVFPSPLTLPSGASIQVTVSVGFTRYPLIAAAPDLLGWEEMVNLADIALYGAKGAGRDAWVGLCETSESASAEEVTAIRTDAGRAVAKGVLKVRSSADEKRVRRALVLTTTEERPTLETKDPPGSPE